MKSLLIIISLLLISNVSAHVNLDSLDQELLNLKGTKRVDVLNQLAFSYKEIDHDKSLEYCSKALESSKELEYKSGKAFALKTKASLALSKDNVKNATVYNLESLSIYESIGDKDGESTLLNNLGTVFSHIGEFEKGLEYFHKSLVLEKELGNKLGMARAYNNIGAACQELERYTEANKNYLETLSICNELNNQYGIALSLKNIGIVYAEQKNFAKALEYSRRALIIDIENNQPKEIIRTKLVLGNIYLELENYSTAKQYLAEALASAQEMNEQQLIRLSHMHLSDYNRRVGDFENAYKNHVVFSEMEDSITNIEVREKIADAEEKYESVKSKTQLALQEKEIEKQILVNAIILLVLFFVVIIAIVLFQKYRLKSKINKELKDSNATKDRFFTIIAHDLKSPFNGLLGATSMLLEENNNQSEDDKKELTKVVHNLSLKVYNLLEGLLDWSSSQTGKMSYEPEDTNLHKSVASIIDLLETNATSKDITILNSIDETISVFADAKATETVLRNLIANAIKFTNLSGKIIVEAENKDDEVCVSISDNGIGMSKEVQNKLFRIDLHHSTAGTAKESGTGIGLIICKELVEKQNGRIFVESELGKGSKFTFTLLKK